MRRTPFPRATPVAALVAVALAGSTPSFANGRLPASVNIRFAPDAETIYLPVTFGLVKSSDGGQTFRWLCERGIGYGGTYDPHYAVTAEGSIYATTFDGLRVSHDGGCTFETIEGLDSSKFLSGIEIGPDGRIWVPTSNGQGGNDVWVSSDGTTFVSGGLAEEKLWWLSINVAPSDAQRMYVTGYLPREGTAEAQPILRRSIDGGVRWQDLPTDDFVFADRRDVYLLGVSPKNPDIVFAKVLDAIPPAGDVLYRSDNGGLNWTKVATFANELLAFLIRADGETVIAGTVNACPDDPAQAANGCVLISREAGAVNTWQRAEQQPRLACLGERSDGVLFACADNWNPDNFALGRSTDGETWEPVYRFSETVGPAECPAETLQSECAAEDWPDLCFTLGICGEPDAGPSAQDAGEPGEDDGSGGGGGCCRVGGSTDAGWIPGLLLVLAGLAWRSRRRARRLTRT